MTWRTLDLFCGAAGGWSLGLHHAGFTTVAACEIDPWRRAVFGQNNPGAWMYDDIRTLDADRLRRDLGFLPDIICGSPPCQDASTANTKGRGVDGERTGLFFDAVRLVREVRPRWVLLENMAITIMGGLFIGTFLTILFLPALYALWFRKSLDELKRPFVLADGNVDREENAAAKVLEAAK